MKLAGMVMTRWAPYLTDRAFRVLMRMAHTALDEPTDKNEAGMFTADRGLLLSVMRAERHGDLGSLERAVERAIKDLIQIGAIERVNRPGFGRRANYRLTLVNTSRIDGPLVDNGPLPDTRGRALPDTTTPLPDTRGRALPDTRGSSWPTPRVGPKEYEEEPQEDLKEQTEEDLVDGVPRVTPARDANQSQIESANLESKCGDPTCILGYRYDKTLPKHERNFPCPICSPNVIPIGRKSA